MASDSDGTNWCAAWQTALDEDQVRGGGDGGLLTHSGGFSGSPARSSTLVRRGSWIMPVNEPSTLQHLVMQAASAGHCALTSQHGQPPDVFIALWQSTISAVAVEASEAAM